MKSLLTPCNVSALQSFQSGTTQALEKVELAGVHADTSKDGKVTWLYHGSALEVISSHTRDRLASWQFGAILKDTETSITAVKEISYEGSLKLVVGVRNSTDLGTVCLLDVTTSQVVKAIEIPEKVTCVEPVHVGSAGSVPEWAINEQMRVFRGILAVGTEGGYIYLVDLNLDDEEMSDEVSPSALHYITPRCRNIKQTRTDAISQGTHLCMILDENSHSKGEYCFRRPDDTIVKVFRTDSISITCLKYIPQDGNLAVGFSFGGFQLWKLYSPVMEYSSRLEADPAAVSHFLYQEPENDPKNFCYIWVARDNSLVSVGQESISTVCLYQLNYAKKTWYASYGVFYEELHSVCLRIEHNLAADPYSNSTKTTWTSQVVSCYTISDPVYTPPALLHEDESFEESAHGPDLSLCVFVWEVQDNGPGDRSFYYLGLFDMNRWYHAQMPTTIRTRESTMDLCSYFAVYQLNEICDVAAPDALLHVHVRADTLKRYINNSPLTPEQHFYPSSLAFDAVCIFETGQVSGSFLGRQRQVLYNMEAKGPSCLLQPQDLYNICVCVGLLPRDLTTHSTPMPQQRTALLNMALDHSQVKFINNCIIAWGAGEFVQQGCTLKFILDWAWDRVASTKQNIDNVCTPLYDWSGNQVDHRLLQVLHRSKVTLQHLRAVMMVLLTQSCPTTEQGVVELETRLNIIHYLLQHLQLVLWFIDAGLLPESDEIADEIEGLYRYPVGNLTQAFSTRRGELQKLHSDIGSTELLMIDGLIESCGDAVASLWEGEGGNGLYPPPSLHALLNIYLLEDVSIGVKHSIVFYLLLDLASLVEEDKHDQFADKIAKFAKSFSLPLCVVKQIQAFWLLDHKDFEEAFFHLLHPMANIQLGSWQQSRVLKSLLYQGESRLALRYTSLRSVAVPTQEEIKLKLTVLLANGLITEAFEYQRACRDKTSTSDLLTHLFLGCQQTHTIDQLLQLSLSEIEERHLEDYLLESSEPHSAELLVMHYLQRARYIEAIRLNEKIKHRVMTETSAKGRERASTRNMIVDGFFQTLPVPQRKLVREHPVMPKKNFGKGIDVQRPKPLSTVVTQSEKSKVISHSSLILAMMEKVKEVVPKDESPVKDDKETDLGPFLCTPITPRKKMKMSEPQDVIYPSSTKNEPNERRSLSAYQVTRDPGVLNSPLSVSKSLQASRSAKRNRYSSASTMALLQTPKVHRKSPNRPSLPSSLRTPQSILKVRRLITKSPSPASNSLDISDRSPSTSHRPKRLGFTLKVASPVTDMSRLPGSTSSTPKQPTPKPSTSKAVSQAIERQSGSTSVPTTPKYLRFVEPVSDEDKAPVKKSPPSPGSPRSVKDRSPTPENLSPKMAARMDSLIRQPLHAERQRGADEVAAVVEDDDDITFNFNPADSDEMEVDEEVPAPPVISQSDEGAVKQIVELQETESTVSVSQVDEHQGTVSETSHETFVQETTSVTIKTTVVTETTADSTVGKEASVVEIVDDDDEDDDVQMDDEMEVTSTQVDSRRQTDSSEDNANARSSRSSPSQSLRESSSRNLGESPSRSSRESPSKTSMEEPSRTLRESPSRSLRESPSRSLRESPSRSLRESPSRSLRESPSRSLRESPSRSLRESSSKTSIESPSRSSRESLSRTSVKSSSKTSIASSPKARPGSPSGSGKDISPLGEREMSRRSLRTSPSRTLRESPARSLRESPARSLRATPERSVEVHLEAGETDQIDSGRSSPRKDSPTRRREQSWLKMESPVKVFDELFAESPGKSTRSVTQKIMGAETKMEASTSASKSGSRETEHSSPSASPVRHKSISPARKTPKTTKSPSRRKKSDKKIEMESEAKPTSPTSAQKSSKERIGSPAGKSTDEDSEAPVQRAKSKSPGRKSAKSAAKASPSRRKSKKDDGVSSPEREKSMSPARQGSKSAARASPGRRVSKKDKVDEASPERAMSTSPTRTPTRSPSRRTRRGETVSPQTDTVSTKSTRKSPARSKKGVLSDRASSASPQRLEKTPEPVPGLSPSRHSSRKQASKKSADAESAGESASNLEPTLQRTPDKVSHRKTRGSPARAMEKSAQPSPGRGKKKQMTKIKNMDEDSSPDRAALSPGRPSSHGTRSKKSEEKTETVEATTSLSKQKSEEDRSFKTPPRPTRISVPLTPPESGKDSPVSETEEVKTKKRSPARKSAASTRHTTRVRSKNVAMESQDTTQVLLVAAAQAASSFHFSEPMSVEAELQAKLEDPSTPVKSFIFSPPIARKRSAPAAASTEADEAPIFSMLPSTSSAPDNPLPPPKTKAKKAVKKETSKKKKVVGLPETSPSNSPINFISPAPARRVTRAMDKSGEAPSTSTEALTVNPFKRKTRKKSARLY